LALHIGAQLDFFLLATFTVNIMFTLILLILLALSISAFFSAAETAVTKISDSTVHQKVREGNKAAKKISRLREDKERLIGTILLGNNLANILASSVATAACLKLFGEEGIALATIIMTTIIVVFAEVLPKTYAFEYSDHLAFRLAPPLSMMVRLFYPFTTILHMVVRALMRILRLHQHTQFSAISQIDALRGAIDFHHHQGAVIKHERDMLGSILDLKTVDVEQIMVHRKQLETINVALPISEIVAQVLASNHTRIPLWQGNPDNIIGIVHIRDLLEKLISLKGNINRLNIIDIAVAPWFIPGNTLLSHQLAEFRQRRAHFAVVVDEYGAVMGIVTLEDILEEIVGQIEDEHDNSDEHIVSHADGSYTMHGKTTIREINRGLDLELPSHEANTIAGLVMFETESVPEVGQSFELYGLQIEILAKENTQITEVSVRKRRGHS
jgi:Mg2+/Co2+ transporter CorB